MPHTPSPVADESVREPSQVVVLPSSNNGQGGWWKWLSLVLGVLLTGGVLVGSLGRAFYVTRTEYTEQSQKDAVGQEATRQTLERLDRTLQIQASAFQALSSSVQAMQVDLAVIKRDSRK